MLASEPALFLPLRNALRRIGVLIKCDLGTCLVDQFSKV